MTSYISINQHTFTIDLDKFPCINRVVNRTVFDRFYVYIDMFRSCICICIPLCNRHKPLGRAYNSSIFVIDGTSNKNRIGCYIVTDNDSRISIIFCGSIVHTSYSDIRTVSRRPLNILTFCESNRNF